MKGAIFDMDGTLLDSMGTWDRIVPQYLINHGVDDPGDINGEIAAMTFEDGIQYTIKRFGLPMTASQVMQGISDRMLWEYTHTVRMKPGVLEYLKKLRQEGIPMCIATATGRALSLPALRCQGILDFFQFVLTVEEVGVGKEYPDIFLQSARRMGLAPKDCCVFEDALHGIRSASSAGFQICAVKDEGSAVVDREEIRRLSDICIESFRELL